MTVVPEAQLARAPADDGLVCGAALPLAASPGGTLEQRWLQNTPGAFRNLLPRRCCSQLWFRAQRRFGLRHHRRQ